MLDAQLAGHNDSSKGEGTAHVDGTVVKGHGSGLALGEQLRYEAEAHWVLCGLSSRKPNPGSQELPKAVHLHSRLLGIIAQHRERCCEQMHVCCRAICLCTEMGSYLLQVTVTIQECWQTLCNLHAGVVSAWDIHHII